MKAIIALQKLVLDPSSKISDILRHAYLIACKLNLEDFKKWCELELNGYHSIDDSNIPEYRYIFGSLCLTNSLSGQTAIFNAEAIFSGQIIKDGISFFEGAIKTQSESITLEIKSEIDKILRKSNPQCRDSHFIFQIRASKIPFQKALDMIKFKILEISYQLEKEGILGEEWEFTATEKEHILNVHYNIETVKNMANHNIDSFIDSN
ncbi:hypothetical protein DCO44_16050 [Acinetobacter sp. AM]|jgi:hypothetical protein|uniref:AbiTii domain-containing protein n=1 Tax=Acinetobacter sp. AM TaxID=2170730 RepID=UPI000DE79BB3|nr:hypothetical protein [Acinetobacter sp. AM]PWB13065.1 hypothetical protein DCO44_16050 [Acinetobacter sp. AM]